MEHAGNLTISRYSGTPYEVGHAMGRDFGNNLESRIDDYILTVDRCYGLELEELKDRSRSLLSLLPMNYVDECKGIADGAGCSLDKICQWLFCDVFFKESCSSFVAVVDGIPWIGRNNDYLMPKAWNNLIVREINNRIPTMLFSMEGDLFSGTGVNKERLWLHYNWLPKLDGEARTLEAMPPYVFLREALETSSSIDEVKHMLSNVRFDGCFTLFAVDGKTNKYGVLECTPSKFAEKAASNGFVAAANHYTELIKTHSDSSVSRLDRMYELARETDFKNQPHDIITILSDSGVEQNNGESGTVYANIACPCKNLIWYAYDGFPAASESNWIQVQWPWN